MTALRSVSAWLLLAVSAAGGVLVPVAHRATHAAAHASAAHEHGGAHGPENLDAGTADAPACPVCEWLARASATVPPDAATVPEPPALAVEATLEPAAVWTAPDCGAPPGRGPPVA